jgi:hypothetical protein
MQQEFPTMTLNLSNIKKSYYIILVGEYNKFLQLNLKYYLDLFLHKP